MSRLAHDTRSVLGFLCLNLYVHFIYAYVRTTHMSNLCIHFDAGSKARHVRKSFW